MNDLHGFLVHCGLFVLLTWLSSIVYHGLRRESVAEIIAVGTRWAFYCIAISVMVGAGLHFFTRWL
ncbi:MAG: hypothetical protein U1E76_05690 [Planctomycetota bacterium]